MKFKILSILCLLFLQVIMAKTLAVSGLPVHSDKVVIENELKSITFLQDLKLLRSDLELPLNGNNGTLLTWKSDKPDYLSNAGKVLKFPAKGKGSLIAHLTVKSGHGKNSASRKIEVRIPEDEGYSAYLFVYFTGNSGDQESIRFALSNDGFTYHALNNNLPVLGSDTISVKMAVRDPHILRGADGNSFYMVCTDMKSDNGWSSNNGMVLLKSTDLVNWKSSRVNIGASFSEFSTVNRVWAPQTIYDSKAGKYMIYWSMRSDSNPDVIYYAYANKEFTALVSTPKILFKNPNGNSCIDGDITCKDGLYNLFFKTEANGNGIKKAVSQNVNGPYELHDKSLEQTTKAVEGACVFKLINSDTYILMYDVYSNGAYEFTKSTDLNNFSVVNNISMDFSPRHGTVIPITKEEASALAQKWVLPNDLVIHSAKAENVLKNNIVIDSIGKKIFLPVKNGTDLTSFDPQLITMPGVIISPKGPQNFTKGPVNYTLSNNKYNVNYTVTSQINKNPVLAGYYADPEILYAKKTGRFYLYPTSDGFAGWSGYYFKVFSSDNMVDWKDEGVILNLAGKDVSWAKANAWAPCIIEKKINGEYRYFYYFTAGKKVGVAVASNPTGPFVDSGKPLIDKKPEGVKWGQEIDPDVFEDPATGKCYLYWGNGYMAAVELNADMVSVKQETMKVITPKADFREGTYVIYRDGMYYFLWSEEDTGSPDYKVCYGTSSSPMGPINIPAKNIVISRDNSKAIYGTGHNSVVQIPGKDEWYIVYHRFTRPKGIEIKTPGYFREVCIDKMEFNADGSIKKVQPTIEGIAPVSIGKDGFKSTAQQ